MCISNIETVDNYSIFGVRQVSAFFYCKNRNIYVLYLETILELIFSQRAVIE